MSGNQNPPKATERGPSEPKLRKRPRDQLADGLYTGFVEWRSPPKKEDRKAPWVAGFVIGFGVKLVLILYFGASFIPT